MAATAGWASDTQVDVMQNRAQASAPACWPAAMVPASTRKLTGRPQVMSRSTWNPLRNSQGVSMPQLQKVHSMQRLMKNRPVAASSGV